MMLKNEKILSNSFIVFLSKAELREISGYDSLYKIKSRPNMSIGKDIEYSYLKYLNKGSLPLLAIYDKSKKLVIIIVGEVKETELNSYIEPAI